MRLFIAALAFGLTAAASAAPLQITPALLHAAAPPLHTPAANALAVQKLLHLQVIPTLGQPISLTPGTPFIPGLGELDLGGVGVIITGNLKNPQGVSLASMNFVNGGPLDVGMQLIISGRAGQHYAFDCRVAPGPFVKQYTISGAISATGAVQASADGHFVFATQSLPVNGNIVVTITQAAPSFMVLYGCDVSPF